MGAALDLCATREVEPLSGLSTDAGPASGACAAVSDAPMESGCSDEDAMLAAKLQAEELQQFKLQRPGSSGSQLRPSYRGRGSKGVQKVVGRRQDARPTQGPLDMLFKRNSR